MLKLFKLALIIITISVAGFFVSQVNAQTDTEITFGSESSFNNASTSKFSVAKLSSDKFVVAYQDGGESNSGSLIIGQVLDKVITYGSEYAFNSGTTNYISLIPISETKFILSYQDKSNDSYGTIIVGEVNGTTVVFGSEYAFNPTNTSYISLTGLSDDKFVVAYQDGGSSDYGQAIIGQVLGTEITFGSEYAFNPSTTGDTCLMVFSASNFIIVYQDGGGVPNYGTGIIGSILPTFVEDEVGTPTESVGAEPEPQPEPEITDLNDGDLIRNSNVEDITKFDIYIVKIVGDKKFKRLILSPSVFESYEHLNWEDVKDVDQLTINAYTTSDLVRTDGDDKVYQLFPSGDTGTKQWLNITAQEFIDQGYDGDSIYEVNSVDINSYE